jgi:threonine aldolase
VIVDEVIETNIVMIDLAPPAPPAMMVFAMLYEQGVMLTPMGPSRLRAVTHLDVDRAACERAADMFVATVKG